MVFNSNAFLLAFFPVLFTLFRLSRSTNGRYLLLTAGGYVFLGYWNWKLCFLLLFSSLVSFFAALRIEGAGSKAGRRFWIALPIATSLVLLGFFKYYNFFAGTLDSLLPGAPVPILDMAMPIGISFYTFNIISYILDIGQGEGRATRSLLEYLTYVSLFSQLAAGPIVRFSQVEDDLQRVGGVLAPDDLARGVGLFTIGLAKKVIVADTIALFVDPMLSPANYASLSMGAAWLAALGYGYQLYFDFGGYSDMAVGMGLLFGFHIPQNFNSPFRAQGISDFWRRWHMTLSGWFRDYVFLRLAYPASRMLDRLHVSGRAVNMGGYAIGSLATMLLCGLWHGANWTFVVWGGYHGILLAIERPLGGYTRKLPAFVMRMITFLLVTAGWTLFRSTDFHMAAVWLGKMVGFGTTPHHLSMGLSIIVLAGFAATNLLPESWDLPFSRKPRWAVAFGCLLFVCYLFINGGETVFLYYRF